MERVVKRLPLLCYTKSNRVKSEKKQYLTKKIYADSELEELATIRNFRIVQTEGSRQVRRDTKHYNLQMIIAVGFKGNNERAVQLRKWANRIVRDYTIKGWGMDDERLKRGTYLTDKYFDEQLERIREIRAGERKFYQKITDIYATAIDYDKVSLEFCVERLIWYRIKAKSGEGAKYIMKNYKGQLKEYEKSLRLGEKCPSTIKQYMHHVGEFVEFLDGAAITKADVINYKECARKSRKAESVNNRLAAVNGFLKFVKKENCRVKNLRVQKNLFAREEKELTRKEYQRLLEAAGDSKISYIMQTIVATGIRISELQYITVDAVLNGETVVDNKNKIRRIFLPKKLCWILKQYMKNAGIMEGSLFVTRNGNPLDRSYVWKLMKKLCKKAGVAPEKVFLHNLRHLFARTFYSMEKDIVRLADLLGHSNIQTTRIYTIESGESHRRGLERVQAALLF